jgi:AcrR family transcriptional regulator
MKRPTRIVQREETRQRLLNAARSHFEVHGFESSHLRDIATDAGVALGTVFVHFADKRDLLHAALFEDLETALDRGLHGAPSDLVGFLDHLTGAMFGYYASRPALSRALLRESLLAEPPWNQRFAAQHARVHAAVVARAGDDPTEAGLLGIAFLSFFQFALLAWAQGAHPDPRGLVSRLVAQHLRGVSR